MDDYEALREYIINIQEHFDYIEESYPERESLDIDKCGLG